jgi:hypothetical protein
MHLLVANNSASASVAGAYESIATATGTGSSGTITFSSIPSTYQHLQVRWNGRTTLTGSDRQGLLLRFNGDTSGIYDYHGLFGDGSTVNASAEVSVSGSSIQVGWCTTNNVASDTMATGIIDIHDYASTTKNTVLRTMSGFDLNGSGRLILLSGGYRNTAAINSITLFVSNNFTTNTTFSLYGIKGA